MLIDFFFFRPKCWYFQFFFLKLLDYPDNFLASLLDKIEDLKMLIGKLK